MRNIKIIPFLLVIMLMAGHGSLTSIDVFGQSQAKYQCPMHPSFVSDKPGDCAICGMKLVKVQGPELNSKKESMRKILYYRHPMFPKVTSPIPAKDEMGMDYVPIYEQRNASPNTGGDCYFHECPMIKGGQSCPMLVLSVNGEEPECPICKHKIELSRSRSQIASKAGYATILITQEKQKLIGIEVSPVESKSLGKVIRVSGEIVESDKNPLYIAPRGQALVYANVDKADASLVKVGQIVQVEAPKTPGTFAEGRVQYVDAVPNRKTRLIKIRAFIPNLKGLFKPDTPVSLSIKTDLDEALAVPETAIFVSDKTRLVFVDKGNGIFEPRPVTLGQQGGGFYEVKEGLNKGERVITNGNFLVDSESRLKAALNEMSDSAEGKAK